ncbi:GNAT family N-acetyltransferase [Saccharopolyspora sp. WRP15-2]|uniref:Lysine N-acyltransferase MbtK n=1 Tax=Saccharopolyspora oryzae TaxID=2997343 RepID=A0ABT4V1L8_9PSEU|nr:GNAT family N-acetyltransferase [Saccharopolyspora oryzae]MDA3627845.1 GNAT family N-acetyltransferase [Saccharopolyspora oryzae]
MTSGVDLPGQSHQRASALLRRWLAETHTPVVEGPLRLTVGALRLGTEVGYSSPTGAHGFGTIHVLDDSGEPVAVADPALLAAACSADARARALPDAPINSADAGSPVDWLMRALPRREFDPLALSEELVAVARSVSDADEARRWLAAHVEGRLLPAVLGWEGDVAAATVELLTRGPLAVIGLLGRRGVVHEGDLLAELRKWLGGVAEAHPGSASLVEHWLASSTLTDLAVLNGSDLRYRSNTGEVQIQPVRFEAPNPLWSGAAEAPGVPIPVLGGGWSLRPVEVVGSDGGPDVALVHRWMNAEHVAVNWNQAWPVAQWHEELAGQLGGQHSVPCIVGLDGRDVAYLELYRVQRDKLARCYSHDPHDLGVHIAIGEPDAIGRGVGSALLRAVADGLLDADRDCRRVVAEPNVHNGASVGAFGKAGFSRSGEIGLPGKNSALMIFERG